MAALDLERATSDRGRERPFDIVVLAPSVGDDEAIALAEFSARESAATAVLLVRDVPVDGSFPARGEAFATSWI